MEIVPISLSDANAVVKKYHRHNDPTRGHKFSLGLKHDGQLVGVAICGRPVARMLDDRLTAEVLRCCVMDGAPKGACSKLYSACQKVWFAMGGKRLVTYSLQRESGASLRGAGFSRVAEAGGGNWDCPSRPRDAQLIQLEKKWRWEKLSG